jgi:hypothetical protein
MRRSRTQAYLRGQAKFCRWDAISAQLNCIGTAQTAPAGWQGF